MSSKDILISVLGGLIIGLLTSCSSPRGTTGGKNAPQLSSPSSSSPIFSGGTVIPQISEATASQPTENETLSDTTPVYLGTWAGSQYVEVDFRGTPVLAGIYTLVITFSEGNHAVAKSDAIEGVDVLTRLLLLQALRDYDNVWFDDDSEQLETTGAIWEETTAPEEFLFTLNIKEDPDSWRVVFPSRDSLVFHYSDSDGDHETVLFRQ